MKYFIALAAFAVSLVATNPNFEICGREACKCPEPNVFPGDISKPTAHAENDTCFCSCGKEIGNPCDTDGHCAKGSYCGAPADITVVSDKKKGICTDRCTITKCPAFHTCVIDKQSGDAMCECQKYKCISDPNAPVYKAEREGQITNFESMCAAINTNCDLKRSNANAKLWRFVSGSGGFSR